MGCACGARSKKPYLWMSNFYLTFCKVYIYAKEWPGIYLGASHESSTHPSIQGNYFHRLAMFLIMMFGIIGNTSISIIILKNKLLRLQPINLFLLNLAVSDLLHLCVSTILFLFRRNILFTNYYLGRFCCLSTPFLNGKYSRIRNKRRATFINFWKNSGLIFKGAIIKLPPKFQN